MKDIFNGDKTGGRDIISLTGFMGCGKSTVGMLLARELGCACHDLDKIIESYQGRSIPEIFSSEGEKVFREMEVQALELFFVQQKQVEPVYNASRENNTGVPYGENKNCFKSKYKAVLSLGGGTLTTAACRSLVESRSTCIYLKASEDTILHNLITAANESGGQQNSRPMLAGANDEAALRNRVRELMLARESIYENSSAVTVITDSKTPEQIAEEIIVLTGCSDIF